MGGSWEICEAMRKHLGNKVKLESVVTKIKQTNEKVTIECENGNIFECKYLIVAIPPALYSYQSILFSLFFVIFVYLFVGLFCFVT